MELVACVSFLVNLCLLAFIVHQQKFWSAQNQSLVDRIMSDSYESFKRMESPPPAEKKVVIPQDPPEDFRALHGFGGL